MDGSQQADNQPQESIAPKTSPLPLFILKTGFLEICLIIVLLIFIFGILNFLNIIRLDNAFPALSSLPHLQYHNTNNIASPTLQSHFTYNSTQAKNSLETYIKNTLQNKILLSSPPLSSPASITSKGNIFSVQDKNLYKAVLTLVGTTNTPMYFQFYAEKPKLTLAFSTSSQIVAQNIASQIFSADFSNAVWTCTPFNKNGYSDCQYKSKTSQEENQYRIILQNNAKTAIDTPILVGNCLIPNSSPVYGLDKFSCI